MQSIMKGINYDKTEAEADDLIDDLGVKNFPLNCFEIAELLGIKMHAYSEFPEEERQFIISKYQEGFSLFNNNCFHIYYNDSLDYNRTKFTVWHEIGHIQLGHFDSDNKISQKQEEEANHFAAYLMAPLSMIYKLNLEDPQKIAEIFEISIDLACNAYTHYTRAFRYTRIKDRILNGRLAKILVYMPKETVA